LKLFLKLQKNLDSVRSDEGNLKTEGTKKILVTGASGLLGYNIVKRAKKYFKTYEISPTHRTKPLFSESVKMNITNENDVLQVFKKFTPDVVVHTAAETNVDKCEMDKEYALKVNTVGTKIMAEACGEVGAKIVYVSTDYVFNGEKGLYKEEDEPHPINYYGLTKLMGENYVMKLCKDYVVVRTSVLYGWHRWKPNFVTWTITSLKTGRRITVVNDHFNSPTLADNLAEAILEVIENDLIGLYHVSGRERISRFEFALKIAENFDLDSSLVKPIRMNELKVWVAKRPIDSSLCVNKIQKELRVKLLNVEEGLCTMRKEARE